MKARGVLIGAILLAAVLSGYAAEKDPVKAIGEIVFGKKYASYDEVEKEVGMLREAKENEKAIEVLESVKEQFPDNLANILVDLSSLYRRSKNYEKALEVYYEGVNNDIFFRMRRGMGPHIPEEKREQFREVVKKNERLRARAQHRARVKYEVVRPEGFSEDKSYPLLMVLHEGNRTIENAKKHWKSEILGKEYLVGFVQSSLVQTSAGFSWGRSSERLKEIDYCYKKIIEAYPSVDKKRVYIGGFSAGGAMAMNTALRAEAPISGFIGACPARGRGYEPAEVARGVERGVKGVIIAGGKDPRTKKLKGKVLPSFEEGGLACNFVAVEGLGHSYADNFSELIDNALGYLQKGEQKGKAG